MMMMDLEQSYLVPLDPVATEQVLSTHPFIKMEGVANFRDLGLLPASPPSPERRRGSSPIGALLSYISRQLIAPSAPSRHQPTHKTRPNRVYRSAQLSHMRPSGLTTLLSPTLRIRAIFDLRSTHEMKSYNAPLLSSTHPSLLTHGIQVYHVPVVEDDHFSDKLVKRREELFEKDGDEGLMDEYQVFLDRAGEAFGKVFKWLKDHPDEACVFHCALGKDRTGLLAALILMITGVADDIICRDYALSRVGLEHARPFILPLITETPKACVSMMSCRHSTMKKTLAFIRSRYGGAEEYLVAKCGLTRAECVAVRTSLIIPV